MHVSVRVTINDAGLMHERTYTATVQLGIGANVEQAEATARSLMDVCADRAARDFDEMGDGDEGDAEGEEWKEKGE